MTTPTPQTWRLKRFQTVENFGDNLNDFLIKDLYGAQIEHVVGETDRSYLMLIGSLLHAATSQAVVWGSGIISPQHLPISPPRLVGCVRGPLSRQVLVNAGCLTPDCKVAFGDPAFLLKASSLELDQIEKEFDIGLIPHYADVAVFNELIDNLGFNRLLPPRAKRFLYQNTPPRRMEYRGRSILTIDVRRDATAVVADIKRCRCIASSSLHGLIVSDVFGIPNVWMRFGNNLTGGAFKFLDYMMAVKRVDVEPMYFSDRIVGKDIDQLICRAEDWKYEFDADTYLGEFNEFIIRHKSCFVS